MTFAARSLATGLIAGLLLALLLQQVVPTIQLPTNSAEQASPLPLSASMAQVLKNIVQASRQRAWAGGYKSASSLRPATSSIIPVSSLIPNTPSSHHKAFSTTQANMSNSKTFADAIKERRTYYQLNNKAPISDKEIQDIAEKAILHVPSSFNSQSTRLVVLLNKDHEQFWDYVVEVLKPLTPEENFPQTEQKIGGFRAAKGTVSTTHPRITIVAKGGGMGEGSRMRVGLKSPHYA
jgi:hypothetical protein